MINVYKLFYRDRNCHDGDMLCYINENITSKTVNEESIEKLLNSYALVSTNHLHKKKTILLIIYPLQ